MKKKHIHPYGRKTPNTELNVRMAELGFTNASLAKAAGVSAVTISHMRNKKHKHCQAINAAVANVLNSTPSRLNLCSEEAN